ncbi:MAG: hypothetical protein P8M28_03870, partial [Alphaproteobacteria bacterium]|nr:hypothetical protein [Alphaproteobacteria bacterium]
MLLNTKFSWETAQPRTRFTGVPEGCDALLLAELLASYAGSILYVSSDDVAMNRMADSIGFFAPDVQVLKFPAWDCLPYDRVPPSGDVVAERLATLAALSENASNGPQTLVVTTIAAILQRVAPRATIRQARVQL